MAAITIINKHRLLRKWGVLEGEDAEVMALVWIEYFDDASIPWQHWDALYRLAQKARRAAIGRGLNPLDIDAESLALCWPELQRRLRERDVRSGRMLPEMAASDCPRCQGTDMEKIYNGETGKFLGRKMGCDHRPLKEGEPLWKIEHEGKVADKHPLSGV